MSNKLTAPRPEYIEISGESSMVFSDAHAGAIYSYLEQVEKSFNQMLAEEEDPSSSPLSYVDYLILKLRLKQNMGMAGEYLQAHVAPSHLENFLSRMVRETKWRVANGSDVPLDSWLVKGGLLTTPDARGVVLRSWSDNNNLDPNGTTRALGSYQSDTIQDHWHDGDFAETKKDMGGGWSGWGGAEKRKSTTTAYGARVSNETRMKNITALTLILT